MFSSKPIQFVLLGLLIFIVESQWIVDAPPLPSIKVPSSIEREKMKSAWLSNNGSMPSNEELNELVSRKVDDELLFQEALHRQYHLVDAIVRQRLLRNMRFLDPNDTRDDDALFGDALTLAMHLNDLVVHRRLVQMMTATFHQQASNTPATNKERMNLYIKNPQQYRSPTLVTLTQIFFSQDKRLKTMNDDALNTLSLLKGRGEPSENSMPFGDPFLSGQEINLQPRSKIRRDFGEPFATAAMSQDEGRWLGPIQSSYGTHLIWIKQRQQGKPLNPLDKTVIKKLELAVIRHRKQTQLTLNLAILRDKYGVNR